MTKPKQAASSELAEVVGALADMPRGERRRQLAKLMRALSIRPGKDGYTPQPGVDYPTREELMREAAETANKTAREVAVFVATDIVRKKLDRIAREIADEAIEAAVSKIRGDALVAILAIFEEVMPGSVLEDDTDAPAGGAA